MPVYQAYNKRTKAWVKYKTYGKKTKIVNVKQQDPEKKFKGVTVKGQRK